MSHDIDEHIHGKTTLHQGATASETSKYTKCVMRTISIRGKGLQELTVNDTHLGRSINVGLSLAPYTGK